MPWCAVLGKYGWRLHDTFDHNDTNDPRLRAVYAMATNLTTTVSTAINQIDHLVGTEMLRPNQVAVPFGNMHSASLNVPPVSIFVFPGNGGASTLEMQRARRVRIHKAVMAGLMRARAQLHGHESYEWPEFLIEVILMSMTGSESPVSWVPEAAWGGADLEELQRLAAQFGVVA